MLAMSVTVVVTAIVERTASAVVIIEYVGCDAPLYMAGYLRRRAT